MPKPFIFNERAAIEAILYLAIRSKKPDFHKISKLLYFADLAHLEKYGRLICGDSYVAMKHGPVPSGVYDILKAVRNGYDYMSFPSAEEAFDVQEEGNKPIVIPLRQPDLDWLSDSDIECLDAALEKYDKCTFQELVDISHKGAWEAADENDFISLESIIESFGNPQDLVEHLQDPHP